MKVSNYVWLKTLLLLCMGAWLQTGTVSAEVQRLTFPSEQIVARMERLNELGKEAQQTVSYNKSELKNKQVKSCTVSTNNMEEWLYLSLQDTEYTYKKIDYNRYAVVARPAQPAAPAPAPAGQSGSGTLKGKVLDETGDFLPGATVKVVGGSQGSATNLDGDFILHLPAHWR